jgi:hypothetical protein
MGAVTAILILLGALLLLFIVQVIYFATVLVWSTARTRGLGYYGLPPAGRTAFKASLRRHSAFLQPMILVAGRLSTFSFTRASIRSAGLTAPTGTCTEASFSAAVEYCPHDEDVFVVTQMKCGTTWMQHVVYETVMRGHGDIVASGRTLYALSPWLEAVTGVPVETAPLHGRDRPTRIIKTHLPARVCPFSDDARYIYVARHPVSCFASSVDFIASNLGPLRPTLKQMEEWFCSRDMWWGPWTDHVLGWAERATQASNVLFVRFEDMKDDLPGVITRVAAFLDLRPLTPDETAEVARKCSFEYMRRHADAFEMNPPHLLQAHVNFFARGTARRHSDVPEPMARRILAWCTADMAASRATAAGIYSDLAPEQPRAEETHAG